MKKSLTLFFVVLLGIIFTFASLSVSGGKEQGIKCLHSTVKAFDVKSSAVVKGDPDFGNIPLYFIPNQGQVDEKARFYAKTPRYTLWMTREGLVFDSIRKDERDVSRLIFLGSNKNPGMVPIEMTQHKVNYFRGDDSSKWQAGIRTSKAVLYKNVYKDIDLKVYGIESQVEYDWIVKPGANPKDIRFKYRDVSKTQIDKEGNLVITTAFGEMMHKKPVSYQMIDGKRVTVKSRFKKTGENTYGFRVKNYNKNYELIIDPMVAITYSTYLGGSGDENGPFSTLGKSGIAVDWQGQVYVCGYTNSTDFPTKNPCQSQNAGNYDIFVTKFNSDGSDLIYSTYLGGSNDDRAYDIAIDSTGNAYVTGYTESSNFPCKQNSFKGQKDAIFCKLDTVGCCICSWYVGGAQTDIAYGIALDSSNDAYITGYTNSSNFSVTQGAFQTQYGGNIDAFVCKVSCSGIIYCTYLGGSEKDVGFGIALDGSNNAYVTGYTESDCFPLNCPCQGCSGKGRDAFVAKLNPALSSLICCKCLQGSNTDSGTSIAVDRFNNIYVSGETNSFDFPIKNAIQADLNGGYDAFVTKLESNCGDFVYSTYLGGYANDIGWHLTVDDFRAVYLTGYTESDDFPTKNPFQPNRAGDRDLYAVKIDPNGTHLIFSTYLGGSSNEVKGDIAIGCGDNPDVYVTGGTESDDFPVHNPYQCTRAGNMDAFVTRYTFSGCAPVLWVSKTLLNFGANADGDTTGNQGFIIRNIGGGALGWQITDNAAWLLCTPSSGRNFRVVVLSLYNVSGLAVGHHEAEITITASNAVDSPKKIYVTLWKYAANPQPGFDMPFGSFDSPVGPTVYGSVPFSGWALDDIEVESVKLYYEDGSNLVYVGEATFVNRSRPDVWQVYPDYPYSQRAGWGYVLISNLYDNGSYTFHAVASDVEGNQVTLGKKTIQISNSIYPFGDITKPKLAGPASGSNYRIEGWALTPLPNCMATVEVFIDDDSLGFAEYGDTCTGITIPPGYCDSDAACFHYDLNTIGYCNGIHEIYCKITDNGAVSATIGSRYFNILNTGTINSLSQTFSHKHYSMTEIAEIPINHSESVKIKKGYGKDVQPQLITPDKKGHIYIQMKELERIKVQLNTTSEIRDYTGYHIVGDRLLPLPIGSTLDREKGIFYWQAGAGFIGYYQLIFIGNEPNGAMSKKLINVKIVPKFSE